MFFLFLLISFFSFSVSVFSGGDGAASKGPESRDGREPRRLLGVGGIVVSSGGDTVWPRRSLRCRPASSGDDSGLVRRRLGGLVRRRRSLATRVALSPLRSRLATTAASSGAARQGGRGGRALANGSGAVVLLPPATEALPGSTGSGLVQRRLGVSGVVVSSGGGAVSPGGGAVSPHGSLRRHHGLVWQRQRPRPVTTGRRRHCGLVRQQCCLATRRRSPRPRAMATEPSCGADLDLVGQ